MSTYRISDQLAGWLDDELGKQAFGEDFRYDIGWRTVQTKQGALCMHDIVVTLRHPLVGHKPITAVCSVVVTPTNENEIRAGVAQVLTGLRERHRTILQQLKGSKPATVGPSLLS